MTEIIYIPLEDEGVPVRRPVPAFRRPDGRFIVLRPSEYLSDDETWAFPPGTTVECEYVNSPEGPVLTAVRRFVDADAVPGKRAV